MTCSSGDASASSQSSDPVRVADVSTHDAHASKVSFGAAAWTKWFPWFEQGALPISRHMIKLAGIDEGARVLDVGTGNGEPALTAALSVGKSGHVTGIDPDAEMIGFAIDRAREAKITNATFSTCLTEELEAPVHGFDAVLCRWALMFVDDLGVTLGRLNQLLRPGGRLVATTWGPPDRVPTLSLARWTVHKYLGRTSPPHGSKTAFALADTAALAEAFRKAGFVDVSQEWVDVVHDFSSVDNYIEFRTDWTGSLFSGVGKVSEAQRDGAIRAIAEELERFRRPDGTLRLVSQTCCTAATAAPAGPAL